MLYVITEVFWTEIWTQNTSNNTIVLISNLGMKRDEWLKEPSGVWVLRFRYDWSSWDQNPKVIVDKGRLERNGIPLLKSRTRMRRNLAIEQWRKLLAAGWRKIKPQWE